MKAESNIKPKNKFEIENIVDGKCDIVFFDNIQEVEPTEEQEKKYIYDTYRLQTIFRDNLEEDLESNYKIWLDAAQKKENEENAKIEIEKLKQELNNTDYKIIKCSEYQLAGLKIPYYITELHANRQMLRDRINELQEL